MEWISNYTHIEPWHAMYNESSICNIIEKIGMLTGHN